MKELEPGPPPSQAAADEQMPGNAAALSPLTENRLPACTEEELTAAKEQELTPLRAVRSPRGRFCMTKA